MDRFYVISNSMKDPEGKIAKEIKAYLNFRGKQCIIQERQGKESLRSYKYTNANLIPDDTEWKIYRWDRYGFNAYHERKVQDLSDTVTDRRDACLF